jgi:hypothetical protein
MGDAGGGRADDDPSRWPQFRGAKHELREVIMAKPFKWTINVDTEDYPGKPPYQFTGGVIDRVAIDVSGEPYHDLEREAALMLMRE